VVKQLKFLQGGGTTKEWLWLQVQTSIFAPTKVAYKSLLQVGSSLIHQDLQLVNHNTITHGSRRESELASSRGR
jgi:hypothetical protein